MGLHVEVLCAQLFEERRQSVLWVNLVLYLFIVQFLYRIFRKPHFLLIWLARLPLLLASDIILVNYYFVLEQFFARLVVVGLSWHPSAFVDNLLDLWVILQHYISLFDFLYLGNLLDHKLFLAQRLVKVRVHALRTLVVSLSLAKNVEIPDSLFELELNLVIYHILKQSLELLGLLLPHTQLENILLLLLL